MAEGLSASMEDYVEAIYQIKIDKDVVRSKDIAARLNVTRPSVTGALQNLAKQGMVIHEPYEVITLTPKGNRAASDIICRHETLKRFFVGLLGAAEGDAEEHACAMEHAISADMLERLSAFMDTYKSENTLKDEGEK